MNIHRLTVVFLVLSIAVFIGVIDRLKERFYVFDPNTLHRIANEVIRRNLSTERTVKQLAIELEKLYPGHIDIDEEWMFNNAGGAMGAMTLLHCSLSEYVIVFGTTIGTDGHTGRFFADDYFIILEGEQWAFSAGQFDREIYRAGTMHHLARGHAQAYRMPDRCFALEYARGWIPSMLPFGIWDVLFSTLDFHTMFLTFFYYGKLVIRELLQGKL